MIVVKIQLKVIKNLNTIIYHRYRKKNRKIGKLILNKWLMLIKKHQKTMDLFRLIRILINYPGLFKPNSKNLATSKSKIILLEEVLKRIGLVWLLDKFLEHIIRMQKHSI